MAGGETRRRWQPKSRHQQRIGHDLPGRLRSVISVIHDQRVRPKAKPQIVGDHAALREGVLNRMLASPEYGRAFRAVRKQHNHKDPGASQPRVKALAAAKDIAPRLRSKNIRS